MAVGAAFAVEAFRMDAGASELMDFYAECRRCSDLAVSGGAFKELNNSDRESPHNSTECQPESRGSLTLAVTIISVNHILPLKKLGRSLFDRPFIGVGTVKHFYLRYMSSRSFGPTPSRTSRSI